MALYSYDPISAINAANSSAQSYALSSADRANAWSAEQAAITRDFNSREAAKNRDWQEYMSNTAHQREVQDLMAAGLNPILSATGGNGASVGSGSTASASVPSGQKADTQNPSAAIASLLGQFLAAQTAQTNAILSAETQRAIADKQTASAQLVAGINSAASKYMADLSKAASQYAADKGVTHSWAGLLSELITGFMGNDGSRGVFDFGSSVSGSIETLFRDIDQSIDKSWLNDFLVDLGLRRYNGAGRK